MIALLAYPALLDASRHYDADRVWSVLSRPHCSRRRVRGDGTEARRVEATEPSPDDAHAVT
jgi:hypothetical protein